MNDLPTYDDVLSARERIAPYVHRTPVATCATLDELSGATLFFKCEHLQRAGAFKFRGATNAVFSLSEEEAARGVVTHSSGNHGGALARAARARGIPAFIVVPEGAPAVKVRAIDGYGATVVRCEPRLASRETTADRVVRETGATLIHAYDNPRVIAGQGTAALELLEDVPALDVVMTPVGGGGLLSGTALAVRGKSPTTRVIAGEPAAADDAFRSLAAGAIQPSNDPVTIADGLRTSLGRRPFALIRELVDRIVLVDEATIVRSMRLLWERAKLLVEPSSAVPLGAVLTEPGAFRDLRVGIVLSGGNVDLDHLPW